MSHRFSKIIILSVVITCVILASEVFGQESSEQARCSVIDASKPPLYISYSAEQARFKEREQVGLFLHNNSTCLIVVEVPDQPATNGVIFYDIQDARKRKAPESGNYRRLTCPDCWEDIRYTDKILAGRSVAFGVLKKHARRRLTIAVPFLYEWELPTSYMERAKHRVYFYGSEWPEKLP